MAKTESTAVNELIKLTQGSSAPASSDPGAELFSSPKSTRVKPARMTSPIPPLRGAGEVEPLPRRRAPQATSKQAASVNPSPVRISTAEPSHGAAIPPLTRPASTPAARASSPQLPRARTPRGTSVPRASGSPLPVQQRPTMPSPPPPVRARTSAPLPVHERVTVPSVVAPAPQPLPVVPHPQTFKADIVQADTWFDTSGSTKKKGITSTLVVPRQVSEETITLVKKMTVPTIILAIIGVMVGGFFAFDGDGGKKKAASRAPVAASGDTTVRMNAAATAQESASAGVAEPEPPTKAEEVAKQQAAAAEEAKASESMLPAATAAVVSGASGEPAKPEPANAEPAVAKAEPAPAKTEPAPVREVQTPRGVVKFVDVRIDSTPPGATVMLVDNGKSSFLGTTPLATSVDPSRKYDVIFTLAGRPTQMAPLDPTTTSRLDVTLGRGTSERRAKKESAAPINDSFLETPKKVEAEKKAAEPAVEKAAAEPAGEGTLMVSSKPPCEIVIDGKPTGLTTPQRSIPLAAGAHKVTFVNEAAGIKKTVSVTITADKPTKLIQDLMQ